MAEETKIEQKLRKKLNQNGFLCFKFKCPGTSGVPDRIIIGNGNIVFVETKAPGEKPRPLQKAMHKIMQDHGAEISIIDNESQIDEFIKKLSKRNPRMNKVASFEKVSFDQFLKDWTKYRSSSYNLKYHTAPQPTESSSIIKEIYDNITLPERSPNDLSRYDIYVPGNENIYPINIPFNTAKIIPTGLKCKIKTGWSLNLKPTDNDNFKYGIRLADTRGIISPDHYDADDEGHILIKIVNESNINTEHISFKIKPGSVLCQGTFTQYGLASNK